MVSDGFRANFIYESDRIEGIRDDRRRLVADVAARRSTGHVGALFLFEKLLEARTLLDEATICAAQALIVRGQYVGGEARRLHRDEVGRYRPREVSIYRSEFFMVGDQLFRRRVLVRRCPSAREVPYLMRNWLRRATRWQKRCGTLSVEENVRRIADLHFDFEQTHPFADGNGRVGRLVAYYQFLVAGAKPFVFTEFDKWKTYYPAFGSRVKMREYFATRVFRRDTIPGRIETVSADDPE